MASDLVAGIKNNAIAAALLYAISAALEIRRYALLAVAIQLAVFLAHGVRHNSERFYDLSGSVTHLALVALALCQPTARSPRQVLTALASTVWAARLGSFLFLRIERDGHDGRFDKLKRHPMRFLAAWTLQAVWVFLIQLPVVLVNEAEAGPGGVLDAPCAAAWVCGFVIEVVADCQKFIFRCDPKNKRKWINSGLFRYSRQPNYFGEILLWTALACSTAVATRRPHALLSPAFTALLLLKVSGLPMNDRAALKKWGEDEAYLWYVQHTSAIVPWRAAPDIFAEASELR